MKVRLACLSRSRLGLGVLGLATLVGLTACANSGAGTGGTTHDNVTIGRSQYDAEGHGFEESWPFGPLRNSAAGDFR